MELPQQLRKYLIMGTENCSRNAVDILREAIQGGITAFQYREKGDHSLRGYENLELGMKLRKICSKNDVLFIVNDDRDLVVPLEADGIHVGQSDRKVDQLRAEFPDKIIGLSVSEEEELMKQSLEEVDYLGAGPVFPTATKRDANPVTGTKWIRSIKVSYPDLPLVGIGGITEENAHQVIEAGADGVAVVSAVTQAANVEQAVRNL